MELIGKDTHGKRTHTCGVLTPEHIGQEVILKGWVDTRRDLGGVIFIDLRDRFGLTQVVFSPQDNEVAHAAAEVLRSEFVISIKGFVKARSAENVNPRLATGEIEVRVEELIILNTSDAVPFAVSAHEEKSGKVNEELRLKYRYLDLRRSALQRNILMRHQLYQITRKHFSSHDFIEVETPVLMKSTPEGARDYLVPSRVHPGQFYALPQSPQTYKQILMVSGLDRYFQITKCFRDEDLRADRQPEFTQIDVEMTFATEEQIYENMEELMVQVWRDLKGVELKTPFRRMPYDEAMTRYGSDKPDLRFGLEIVNLNDAFAGCPFRVFSQTIESGGALVGIRVPGEGERGRAWLDKMDKDIARKRLGAAGLVFFRIGKDGEIISSVREEVLPTEYVKKAIEACGAQNGDLIFLLAGANPKVYEQMGQLRLVLGQELNLIPTDETWEFLWVTDFPLVERDPEGKEDRWYAMHHPFTSPKIEDIPLMKTDPGKIRARAYDLVLNGTELGGGSIRIHNRDVQSMMFELLGIDPEEAQARFGFLLDAFRFGAPPHGGIALGLDRMVMLLTGAASLREVIAFPKTASAQELMVLSPDVVDNHQLEDLHIRIQLPEKK
jgi:aspartyl-tRNA synthetase